ncbi:hypothetical protein GCM10009775_21850 [Microbacterium aoyamense]|uniref:FHA domain-containing protein n=1 Tax=Microbacterium aoyamense TaxID=344166 RepID=A0ABP5B3I5_9MICO|nr:DUF5684 domain-containing protein [Microbacterium aoyamense]
MTVDASTAAAITLLSIVGVAVLYVWTALALAAVFRKSGEQGWKAWVPFLNQAVLLQLGGFSGFLVLFYLLPGLGILIVWVLQTIACHRIGHAFGFGSGMTVLAALLLPVWASIVGFGPERWVGRDEPARASASPSASLPGPAATAYAAPRGLYAPSERPVYGRETHVSAPVPPLPTAPAPGIPGRSSARAMPLPPLDDDVEQTAGPLATRASSPAAPPEGGWGPPPLPARARPVPFAEDDEDDDPFVPSRRSSARATATDEWAALGLSPELEFSGEVTGAIAGAPSPLSAVPEPAVTRVPAASPPMRSREPWAPARSPFPESEDFPDSSGPVSAIVGAPVAGGPLAARSSVSAQTRRREIPDEPVDETVVTRRRRTEWTLLPPSGRAVAITGEVLLLGRRPTADPAHPAAQLIAIDDATVSKTHARLELRERVWFITDLDSTNGIVFTTERGEVDVVPGVAIEAGDRFLLGDAEIRLVRGGE